MERVTPAAAALRRLRQNIIVLASGSGATTLLGVATLALLARALEPASLGVLTLVQAYVVILNRFASFDTWQGVVRFGAKAQVAGDTRQLVTVVTCAVILDAASAGVAGIAALSVLLLMGDLLDIPEAYLHAALFYSVSLFFQLAGAPIGITRLFNRFGWLTAMAVGESAARFLAAAILLVIGTGVSTYIYTFGVILIAANLVRISASLYLLRRETGPLKLPTPHELKNAARGFARFSAGSWITGTLNVSRQNGTIFVVAALLGTGGAGYYAFAQRLVQPIREAAEMLRQALFPDLSRLVATEDLRTVFYLVRRVVLYTVPAALVVIAAFVIWGDVAIKVIGGGGYESAYWILVALTTASALYLCMPVLSSLVILLAGMRTYVMATASATVIWAAVVWLPILAWGVQGAGIGEVVFVVAWFVVCGAMLRAFLARRRAGRTS